MYSLTKKQKNKNLRNFVHQGCIISSYNVLWKLFFIARAYHKLHEEKITRRIDHTFERNGLQEKLNVWNSLTIFFTHFNSKVIFFNCWENVQHKNNKCKHKVLKQLVLWTHEFWINHCFQWMVKDDTPRFNHLSLHNT